MSWLANIFEEELLSNKHWTIELRNSVKKRHSTVFKNNGADIHG